MNYLFYRPIYTVGYRKLLAWGISSYVLIVHTYGCSHVSIQNWPADFTVHGVPGFTGHQCWYNIEHFIVFVLGPAL